MSGGDLPHGKHPAHPPNISKPVARNSAKSFDNVSICGIFIPK